MSKTTEITIAFLIAGTGASSFIDNDVRGLSLFTAPEVLEIIEAPAEPVGEVVRLAYNEPRTTTQTRRTTPRTRTRTRTPVTGTDGETRLDPTVPRMAWNTTPAQPGADRTPAAQPSQPASPGITPPRAPLVSPGSGPAPLVSPVPFVPGVGSTGTGVPGPVPSPPAPPQPDPVVVPDPVPVVTPTPVTPPLVPVTNPDPTPNPTPPAPPVSVVPAVPEPTSWLMMILGVGGLGLVLRYRRKQEGDAGIAGLPA